MKRLISAALIVLLICGAAFPALARGGRAGGHGKTLGHGKPQGLGGNGLHGIIPGKGPFFGMKTLGNV